MTDKQSRHLLLAITGAGEHNCGACEYKRDGYVIRDDGGDSYYCHLYEDDLEDMPEPHEYEQARLTVCKEAEAEGRRKLATLCERIGSVAGVVKGSKV